jgi:Flp pilus assembly pilin Flp
MTMLADLPFVIRALVASRRGASSTEYALVAALISIAAIAALGVAGQEIRNKLGLVGNGFN